MVTDPAVSDGESSVFGGPACQRNGEMITLSGTLAAHQKRTARSPNLEAKAAATRDGFPLLLWERWYTGSEQDNYHATAIAGDGSLVRLRLDAGNLYLSRVANPAAGSTYSTWSLLAAITPNTGFAIASKPGEMFIIYGHNTNSISYRTSTTNGGSWSAPTLIVSGEAFTIGPLACAYNATGDVAFWYSNPASSVVKWRKKTGGAWSALTTWTRGADAATITGIGATYELGDFTLLMTGTAPTTLNRQVWQTRMGDGGLPAGAWQALAPITEADAAGGLSFREPFVVRFAGRTLGSFTAEEVGAAPAKLAQLTHPPGDSPSTANWTEPVPHEAAGAYGLALAYDGSRLFATTPFGVWVATVDLGTDDLTARVLAASYRLTPDISRCRLELDNHDGALSGLPNTAYPLTMPGGQLSLRPGYKSGASAAPEYGASLDFTIDQIIYEVRDGKATTTLDCSGPWETIARYRAPQAWQVAAGTLNRGAIFTRLAARAGLRLTSSSPSADWTATSPAFTIAPGEDGRSILHRLLAVVSDQVRTASQRFVIVGVSTTDTSTYSYGGAGEHGVTAFARVDGTADNNWIRAAGPDRYADDHDFAAIYRHGPQLRLLRNLDLTTNTKAQNAAAAALRRDTVVAKTGELVAPFNAGQELYDVVTVTVAGAGVSAEAFRVVSLGLEYHRGPGNRARYDSILGLGRK